MSEERDFAAEILAAEQAGALPHALDLIAEAIAAFPHDPALLTWRARLCVRLGRSLDAAEAYRTALAMAPDDLGAMFALGLVCEDLGLWEQAVEQWQRLRERVPHEPQPHFQAGAILGIHLLRLDEAMRAFSALPPVLDGFWLSVIADVRRERNAARRRARAALRARKGGASLVSDIGVLLVRDLIFLGRLRDAQATLDAIAAGISVEARLSAQYLIDCRTGGPAAAVDRLGSQVDLDLPPADCRKLVTNALFQAGQAGRAAAIWGRVPPAEVTFDEEAACFRSFFAAGDYDGVLRLGREILARRPYDSGAAQFMLTALVASGRVTMANTAPPEGAPAKIPAVLFRFWDKPEPPADVRAVLDSWNGPDEGLSQVLFDEAAARAFLADAYPPRHLAAFDACHHPAMKSDFLRLCYLAKEGGIYLDVDQARRDGGPSLRASVAGASLVLPLSSTSPFYTNNNIIAAVPGHPVIGLALEEALNLIEAGVRTGARPNIWNDTGPGVFTRNLVRYLDADPDGAAAAAAKGGVVLFSSDFLISITTLINDLAYKGTAAGNWRLI